MCTIIGGFVKNNFSRNEVERLKHMIRLKGGDYTRIICFIGSNKEMMVIGDSPDILLDKLPGTTFLIFSRLTPEMEDDQVKIHQPYKTINGNFITAHGTIPVSNDFDGIIDTEIFRFDTTIEVSINKTNELNGKVSLIQYLPESNIFYGIHNGLGLYSYQDDKIKLISNIQLADSKYIEPMRYTFLSETIDIHSFQTYGKYSDLVYGTKDPDLIKIDTAVGRPNEADVIISLCSGGMDTILSTYDTIRDNKNVPTVELLYFDWGTNAADAELMSNEIFLEILRDDFDADIEFNQIDAYGAFKNILNIAGLEKVRLQDNEAVGEGKHEAENAISYVPMRNTFLILFASIYAEQKYPGKNVQIVLGANLTEGMVYLDNSSNYLSKVGSLIRVAGQKTFNFSVVAPYVHKTKTKMLEMFSEKHSEIKMCELLKASASCYFPKDGLSCGKCGSCLLREKAIQKYEENETKKRTLMNQATAGAMNESN